MAEGENLSRDPELEEIRDAQAQAWHYLQDRESKPDIAIELLRKIRDAVDRREGSEECAVQECLLAMAYAVKHLDDVADDLFRSASRRIVKVLGIDPKLLLDFHRCFGKFFFRTRKLIDARRELEVAEQVAMQIGDEEEVADVHLKLFEVDHKEKRDKHQEEDFTTFRRVARRLGRAKVRQRDRWVKHLRATEQAFANARFARGPAPHDEKYFEDLLSSEDDED
jgi:hypothetical protein